MTPREAARRAARHGALADHRGRPLADVAAAMEREIAAPSTTGVRSILSTHPATGLGPERLAAILREAETPGGAERYLELAEEMEERHLHYLGTLQTRRRAVAQIGVEVIPADDSAPAMRAADTVREVFARPSVEDELYDLLDAIGKGFSASEIVWETSERQWMPARLCHRLPQHFDFDRETGSHLVRRGDDGDWIPLEPLKFVAHVVSAKSGLPIRGGLARAAAWCWMFQSFTLKDWVRYVEAHGQPLRVGRYHANATDPEIAVLKRAVRDLAADCAAVIPEEMDITFVTETGAGAGRSDVFRDLIRHLDDQLSIVVLGQTLTTQPGERGGGSYALGQVHDRVRRDIERSDGRQLAATLRRDLVLPIIDLNHGPQTAYPTLKIEREDAVDVNLLSQVLERLVPLGLTVPVDHVRARLNLPAPADGDDVLESPAPGLAAARHALARLRRGGSQDGIEDAWLAAVEDWRPMLDPLVAPAVAAAAAELERGGGLDALRATLPGLLDGMDDGALAGALERLAFSARIAGRAEP